MSVCLSVCLSVTAASSGSNQVIAQYVSQHGKTWPYWFRKMGQYLALPVVILLVLLLLYYYYCLNPRESGGRKKLGNVENDGLKVYSG